MRKALAIGVVLALLGAAGAILAADKEPPKQVVYPTKQGDVTFDHTKHAETMKNDCKACHDKIFPQEKAPLGYKEGMHKKAEAAKKSCATCHVGGGTAFESKGNCQKCHAKK